MFRENKSGVNLGALYPPITSVQQSPVFARDPAQKIQPLEVVETLRVALVKIRAPQILTDEALSGVGRTLSQLRRLGLRSVVVVDCSEHQRAQYGDVPQGGWRQLATSQADRIVAAIDASEGPGARRLDSIVSILSLQNQVEASIRVQGHAQIICRNLLLAPMKRGVIPVIPPVGFTVSDQKVSPVCAEEIVLALVRDFAGLLVSSLPGEDPARVAERVSSHQKEVSLDRLIILDPLGGIPSSDMIHGAHIFINLEQEYQDIQKELLRVPEDVSTRNEETLTGYIGTLSGSQKVSSATKAARALDKPPPISGSNSAQPGPLKVALPNQQHSLNLKLVKEALAMLPPSSSALLTTPEEAAYPERTVMPSSNQPGVQTRRQRNPLIYNLLTNKPSLSSSLPLGRLGSANSGTQYSNKAAPTTFVKRGMPLTILPSPGANGWTPPEASRRKLTLEDPRIDLPRLIYLIEDSFNRKLDVEHYLSRVNNKIAGVIIAGEYEGGALLTWEDPPGVPSNGSAASRHRKVPYLDKFAVLKRSQGAGGVADIVFKSMVRDCFPDGVCWRSRRDNPVNKWYFERARGTWDIRGTNWTMFWTTPALEVKDQRFLDYEGVCRGVLPSWADGKVPD